VEPNQFTSHTSSVSRSRVTTEPASLMSTRSRSDTIGPSNGLVAAAAAAGGAATPGDRRDRGDQCEDGEEGDAPAALHVPHLHGRLLVWSEDVLRPSSRRPAPGKDFARGGYGNGYLPERARTEPA
jgi:hypothetical protein